MSGAGSGDGLISVVSGVVAGIGVGISAGAGIGISTSEGVDVEVSSDAAGAADSDGTEPVDSGRVVVASTSDVEFDVVATTPGVEVEADAVKPGVTAVVSVEDASRKEKNVFALFTAKATQLKGISTGAALLRSIVKPAVFFCVIKS